MLEHAHSIEVVWFVIALVGLVYAMRTAIVWHGDWRDVRATGAPHTSRYFTMRVISVGTKLSATVQLLLFAMATAVLWLPPPPPDYWPPPDLITLRQQIFTVGFGILLSILTTVQAWLGAWWRKKTSRGDYDGAGKHPPPRGQGPGIATGGQAEG
jgi:hypothetical protein